LLTTSFTGRPSVCNPGRPGTARNGEFLASPVPPGERLWSPAPFSLQCLGRRGADRFSDAIADYQQMLMIRPSDIDALMNLADADHRAHRDADVRATLIRR
jgi:hypothetical protein